MLLNVLWSPKAGLLVDICLLWSYDLYDYQLTPWLRKSHVANLHALQSASGAQQGKSGQQMSLRIFRCRHRSPNSLSFLRFQKLGLVCYEKCCVLPLCPFSASITAPNSFVIRRFFKPQPKLRECFIKIKKMAREGILCVFRTFHVYLQPLRKWSNVTHGGIRYFRSLLIGKIINIAGILLHLAWENL